MSTLHWTTQPPTEPGYYWWRAEQIDPRWPEIVEINRFVDIHGTPFLGGYVAGSARRRHINEMTGEWAGPIPEPEEAT